VAMAIEAIARAATMAIEIVTAEVLDSAAQWGRAVAQEPHAVKVALDSAQEDAAGRTKLKSCLVGNYT